MGIVEGMSSSSSSWRANDDEQDEQKKKAQNNRIGCTNQQDNRIEEGKNNFAIEMSVIHWAHQGR